MFLFKSNLINFEQKMSKPAIKITETLMLRRIDPIIMLKKYLNGDFKTVTIPTNKISLSSAFINLNQRIGSDANSRVYRFNDKSNLGQIIVTTNHDSYQYFRDSSSETPRSICPWSRREILDEGVIIPVYMEIDKVTNKIYFYGEKKCYNFGCALSTLKYLLSCYHNYKDPLYMDADQMLHIYYYRSYPDKIGTRIVEAKHWELLDINQGPLTNEEYDDDQYMYIPVPNVVICPIKRQYIKLIVPKKIN